MDTMALHQAGFETTVASMGTALTKEQARLIKRYADDVYICYDGDNAGQTATLKGLDILKAEGLNVRVIQMPKDVDPDELLLQRGKEAFQELIDGALPLIDYKLDVLKSGYNFDNPNKSLADEAKWQYAASSLNIISKLDNLIEAESYLRMLQKQTGFSLDWLKRQLSEGAKEPPPTVTEQKQTLSMDSLGKAKYFVLSCLLCGADFAKLDFKPDVNDDEFLIRAFEYVYECQKENKKPIPSMLNELFGEGDKDKIDYVLDMTFETTMENEEYFDDCVMLIKRTEAGRRIDELNALYEEEKDLNKQMEIVKQLNELMKEQKKLT
jgi:DNA primase